MRTHFHRITVLIVCLAAGSAAVAERPKQEPISPGDKVIKLFNGKDLSGLYTWLKGPGRNNDPQKAFTVHDGMIHVSGEGRGYVAAEKTYRDYHLIVEYKWGERVDGSGYVRNAGVLLHGTGPDGSHRNRRFELHPLKG